MWAHVQNVRPSKSSKTSKQKGGAREQQLVKVFNDPSTHLYINFLHAVMPFFDSFNTQLQSEEPMLHNLYPSMVKLFRVCIL
jgi:hypothetical protein